MNIDEITIGQARQLAAMFATQQPKQKTVSTAKDLGQNLVILDRGFVYVGNVTEFSDRIRITDAKNVRYWGTKNGLGELRNGPLPETKLDDCGEAIAYTKAVIAMIPCKGF